jgi:nuclear transport factor 2 (NTF2) superfamily protein
MAESRPPFPPFTLETATQKVRMAEDAWNTRDPKRVALAYTSDSRWRNRAEFLQGRAEIEAFLIRKWQRELNYRLIKEIWAFRENRIAVRFAYEWHDDSGNWFRSYGNENWEFDENGLMRLRIASINDLPDQGERAPIPLAARSPSRRSPVLERSRILKGGCHSVESTRDQGGAAHLGRVWIGCASNPVPRPRTRQHRSRTPRRSAWGSIASGASMSK